MEGLLDGLVRAVERQWLAVLNVVVRQNGEVVARHSFAKDRPRLLYSVSKTFTSMAAGCCVDEGRFSLDDRVLDLFRDIAPAEPGPHWADLRVRHLLCMGTGHALDPIAREAAEGLPNDDIAGSFFKAPLQYAPGAHFCYNNAATYMLSLLVKRAAGVDLRDYLARRLFGPLGIAPPKWDADPNGVSLGCTGLHLSAEDLALCGQVLLDGGCRRGAQLLPARYVDMAKQVQISTADYDEPWANADYRAGYGFQMWRNSWPGSCRADGYFGQYVILLPDKNAVVTYLSKEPRRMTSIIRLTWEELVGRL